MRYPLLLICVIFLVIVAGCITQTPRIEDPLVTTTPPLPSQHDVGPPHHIAGPPMVSTYEVTSTPTTVTITIPLPVDYWIEIVPPMEDTKVAKVGSGTYLLTGVTNLEVGSKILIICRGSDGDKIKGMSGEVYVQKGTSGINFWRFPIDLSSIYPGKYVFEAKDYNNDNLNTTITFQVIP